MTPPYTFGEFMVAMHGFEPFPWQQRLADRALDDAWPARIDVPTGLGKTSVIDVAVYALAATASEPPHERRARTRTAFIVDRRVVVQAAFEHAQSIRAALVEGATDVARWAADQLSRVGSTAGDALDEPLVVTQMRGGVTWESRWVRRPDQPAIVVGTVDQLGSRLLFRGYGLSDRMKPIDAALIGSDVLVVLDEAHLSSALVESIGGIHLLEDRASERPLPSRPSRTLELTATPRSLPDERLVDENDEANAEAARRLTAHKRARLVDLTYATGARASTDIAEALAAITNHIVGQSDRHDVVLVVANTVAVARATFERLRNDHDCELVVGRCRPLDRELNRRRWWDRAKADPQRRTVDRTLVIVATQTVEVGADLDVGALVTEVAPIDALVQRFGRVDRLGLRRETDSYIVHAPGRLADGALPYGPSTAATWAWLSQHAGASLHVEKRPIAIDDLATGIDFGSLSLRASLEETDERMSLMSAPQLPPVVLPQCVSVWRRTSPIPDPDESVTSYLHGIGRGAPSVAVAWRSGDLRESLAIAAPHAQEVVEVSLAALRRFLRGEPPFGSDSDVEGVAEPPETIRRESDIDDREVLVRRAGEWRPVSRVREIRAGDVVVLGCDLGGHDQFGWTGESGGRVIDVADLATVADPSSRLRPTLRLDSGTLAGVLGVESADVEACLRAFAAALSETIAGRGDVTSATAALLGSLRSLADQPGIGARPYLPLARVLLDQLLEERSWARGRTTSRGAVVVVDVDDESDPDTPHVTVSRLVAATRDRVTAIVPVDDDEAAGSSLTGREVSLASHLDSVGDRAATIGERLGLAADLVASVRLAGRFHDLGKADMRFQAVLRDGVGWLAEAAGSDSDLLLAKSNGESRRRSNVGPRDWPIGYRHEAVSLALLEAAPQSTFTGIDRTLVAHLVAAHHGFARPLFPPIADAHTAKVRVDYGGLVFEAEAVGSHPCWSQPARFDALCERYGTWGLALLEAIVRLADIGISEEGG